MLSRRPLFAMSSGEGSRLQSDGRPAL